MTSIQKNKKMTGRYIDNVGRVIMNTDGLVDMLFDNKSISGLLVEDINENRKYNQFSDNSLILYTDELQSQSVGEFDLCETNKWSTPKEFQNINIDEWLLARCSNDIQKTRVLKELSMYEERNLYPLLRHLIFLIDHFRKNQVIWGVGRGSSVASYVLFLIGIHKIDSLKYNLEIEEFLR